MPWGPWDRWSFGRGNLSVYRVVITNILLVVGLLLLVALLLFIYTTWLMLMVVTWSYVATLEVFLSLATKLTNKVIMWNLFKSFLSPPYTFPPFPIHCLPPFVPCNLSLYFVVTQSVVFSKAMIFLVWLDNLWKFQDVVVFVVHPGRFLNSAVPEGKEIGTTCSFQVWVYEEYVLNQQETYQHYYLFVFLPGLPKSASQSFWSSKAFCKSLWVALSLSQLACPPPYPPQCTSDISHHADGFFGISHRTERVHLLCTIFWRHERGNHPVLMS